MEKKTTRKNSKPVKVYCLPEELEQIQLNAKTAGLSLSTYLLRLGTGYEVNGILDHEMVMEMAKINKDLGNLRKFLKLWFINDPRAAEFNANTIKALLSKIEENQDGLRSIMQKVVF